MNFDITTVDPPPKKAADAKHDKHDKHAVRDLYPTSHVATHSAYLYRCIHNLNFRPKWHGPLQAAAVQAPKKYEIIVQPKFNKEYLAKKANDRVLLGQLFVAGFNSSSTEVINLRLLLSKVQTSSLSFFSSYHAFELKKTENLDIVMIVGFCPRKNR